MFYKLWKGHVRLNTQYWYLPNHGLTKKELHCSLSQQSHPFYRNYSLQNACENSFFFMLFLFNTQVRPFVQFSIHLLLVRSTRDHHLLLSVCNLIFNNTTSLDRARQICEEHSYLKSVWQWQLKGMANCLRNELTLISAGTILTIYSPPRDFCLYLLALFSHLTVAIQDTFKIKTQEFSKKKVLMGAICTVYSLSFSTLKDIDYHR